jgi:hypothetical protein
LLHGGVDEVGAGHEGLVAQRLGVLDVEVAVLVRHAGRAHGGELGFNDGVGAGAEDREDAAPAEAVTAAHW